MLTHIIEVIAWTPIIFWLSSLTIVGCTILYNIVIHKLKKRCEKFEDELLDSRAKIDELQKKYEETYECYMASLAREAKRDGK